MKEANRREQRMCWKNFWVCSANSDISKYQGQVQVQKSLIHSARKSVLISSECIPPPGLQVAVLNLNNSARCFPMLHLSYCMCINMSMACIHCLQALYTPQACFSPVCHVTVGIASIHILYRVLNIQGQNLLTLYCINTREQKSTFHIMSLISSDKFQAGVAWCVGPVCLTESYCRTSVWSGLWIFWPDITAELSCFWHFGECFMTCVSTDQSKETCKICLHFIFL